MDREEDWKALTAEIGDKVQIVGDDFFENNLIYRANDSSRLFGALS